MITCEICYKELKQMTNTHLKKHNINFTDYYNMFPNAITIDIEMREKISMGLKNSEKFQKRKLVDNWIIANTNKHLCGCGCNQFIIITKSHYYNGLAKYIRGHYFIGKKRPNQCGNNNVSCRAEVRKIKSEKLSGKNNPAYGKPPVHTKKSYYDSPLQGRVCFRSSWELKYAKYLDEINILWLYEGKTFNLGDTTYTPDFFLPQFYKFIEIKGYMRPEAQDKINKFIEQYPWDLKILYKKDLIELGVIND